MQFNWKRIGPTKHRRNLECLIKLRVSLARKLGTKIFKMHLLEEARVFLPCSEGRPPSLPFDDGIDELDNSC